MKKQGEELLYEAPNKKAVTALQSFLNEEGYADQNGEKLWVDGRYDTSTANAVLRYQNENGLKADGITGDKTWDHIYNKKRKKEEDASFAEELKERSNGYFYDKLKGIRQAQRNLGIEPGGVFDGEEGDAASFSKLPFDVWRGRNASSVGIKQADDESLHDRVRKRWENGGRVGLLEVKDYAEERSPKRLPSVPAGYMAKTEHSINEERFSSDFTKDYSAEFNAFETKSPADPSQNKYIYFEGMKEKVETKSKDVAADIILTKIGQYGFVKEEVVRFLSDADPRKIVNANYRAAYDFEENPAKDVLLKVLRKTLDLAVESVDKNAECIACQAIEDLEKFDDTSITTAYYLNDFNGANLMGHAGVLLVNSDGESILFSFYPQNQEELKNSASEMRISVFNQNETRIFIENKKSFGISTSGKYRSEQYENVLPYSIDSKQGKAMFEQAVAITAMDNLEYNLLEQNCDHIALSILRQGGVNVEKKYIPNLTYALEII